MGGSQVIISCMEYAFMGGSMGSVVGEKITRAAEASSAWERRSSSFPARAGPGCRNRCSRSCRWARWQAPWPASRGRIPYISVMTDPTTGGVTASFAMLVDVIIAEPKALIGFLAPGSSSRPFGRPCPRGSSAQSSFWKRVWLTWCCTGARCARR